MWNKLLQFILIVKSRGKETEKRMMGKEGTGVETSLSVLLSIREQPRNLPGLPALLCLCLQPVWWASTCSCRGDRRPPAPWPTCLQAFSAWFSLFLRKQELEEGGGNASPIISHVVGPCWSPSPPEDLFPFLYFLVGAAQMVQIEQFIKNKRCDPIPFHFHSDRGHLVRNFVLWVGNAKMKKRWS